MAQDVTFYGAWTEVPYVTLPKTEDGTPVAFTDVSDTTASAADVNSSKWFYNANGVRIKGTSTNGNVSLQEKTVVSSDGLVIVTPDNGYDGLSQVTIEPIINNYTNSNSIKRNLNILNTSMSASVNSYKENDVIETTVTQAIPTISINPENGLISSTVTQDTGYVVGSTTSATLQLTTQAAKAVVPATVTQTAVVSGVYTTGTINVEPIPNNYILPTGTKTILSNGTNIDVAKYATAKVNVIPNLQNKTITPTELKQTISAASSYDGLGTITVNAISPDYIGSEIIRRASEDVTILGASITVPAGYYTTTATATIATVTQANPNISITGEGLIVATVTQNAGYVSRGTKSKTLQLATQKGKTVIPTTTAQTAVTGSRYTTGTITVAAIPSEYVLPTGTITLSTLGIHNISGYANANVAVSFSNIYSGTTAPAANQGVNGDIYIKTVG